MLFHIQIKDSSSDLAEEQNTRVHRMTINDEQDEAQAAVSRDDPPALVDDEYTIPGQIWYHLD